MNEFEKEQQDILAEQAKSDGLMKEWQEAAGKTRSLHQQFQASVRKLRQLQYLIDVKGKKIKQRIDALQKRVDGESY